MNGGEGMGEVSDRLGRTFFCVGAVGFEGRKGGVKSRFEEAKRKPTSCDVTTSFKFKTVVSIWILSLPVHRLRELIMIHLLVKCSVSTPQN